MSQEQFRTPFAIFAVFDSAKAVFRLRILLEF